MLFIQSLVSYDTLPAGAVTKAARTGQLEATATQSSRKFVDSLLYIVPIPKKVFVLIPVCSSVRYYMVPEIEGMVCWK